jgi:NADH-quinone oxidoreductase subunit C
MSGETILDRLNSQFGDLVTGSDLDALDPWVEVAPAAIADVCQFLKADPALELNYLNSVTAVDYWHADEKKLQKMGEEPHICLVYHLSSLTKKHSLVLKVRLPRWEDGVEGKIPSLPSVEPVWRTADWHEREVFDLFGINFLGHPDLRRILCPEDWVGYPLRRDYEMPLEYHGIRGR